MTLVACPRTVADAAKILDKKFRGWYKKINTETLDINMPRECILGQLFGIDDSQTIFNYDGYCGYYGLEDSFIRTSPFGYENHEEKREQWIAAINYRLKRNARRRELAAKKKLPKLPELPEQIMLNLNKDIYAVAKDYTDNRNCPIATAAKKQFPGYDVSVNSKEIRFYADNKIVKEYIIHGDMGKCLFIEHVVAYKLDVLVIANANNN